jgi:hypothetical protein
MNRFLVSHGSRLVCFVALAVGCAGAQRRRSIPDEEQVGTVSSDLRMRDVQRESHAPGTLNLVDSHAQPDAPTTFYAAAPREASRESRRQVAVPPDLQGQKGAIDACYERALHDDPRLAGTLELAVQISRDGAVRDVTVRRDSVKHRGLRKCVSRAVSELRILENVQGPEVTYPVTFGGSTSELL